MKTLATKKDEQKSLVISIFFYGLLILLLFQIRFWPPSNIEEFVGSTGGGVSVNFGNSEMGLGEEFKNKVLNINAKIPAISKTEIAPENIITEEKSKDDAVFVSNVKITKKIREVNIKEKQKIKSNTNSALENLIKVQKKVGDGVNTKKGNQGNTEGNLTKDGYGLAGGSNQSGQGKGLDAESKFGKENRSGSGYSLNGRKAVSKPKPDSDCSNETGSVVVEVTVDKNGNTISAVVGKRGSTITAKCLKDQARMAALNTKWAPSPDGTQQQVGEIVYIFDLN